MKNAIAESEKARFDTKLTKKQKEFFEYAASIGGFRTLTDFVVSTVEEKAHEIVEKHRSILQSEKDKKIFFDALLADSEPNDALKKAFKDHKKLANKK